MVYGFKDHSHLERDRHWLGLKSSMYAKPTSLRRLDQVKSALDGWSVGGSYFNLMMAVATILLQAPNLGTYKVL